MKCIAELDFPDDEAATNEQLRALFMDWHGVAESKQFARGCAADDMVFDGFYPFYSRQKPRVLFIGREATGIGNMNYIEILHGAYKDNHVGNLSINQYRFHYLMFYITYGLAHGFPHWNTIPPASDLTTDFGTESGISFAFMNLSKLSNESGRSWADWELIDSFLDAFRESKRNFFNEEISILAPDVILSMNLEARLSVLGELAPIEYGADASIYRLKTPNKDVLLIDLFHFAAPSKSPQNDYYEVVKRVVAGKHGPGLR